MNPLSSFDRRGQSFQWLEREGAGRAVLYLHGAGGPRVSPALRSACEGRPLLVPVYPGFGYDAIAGLEGARALARAVARLFDGVDSGFDVVAHSLGGHVALWLAVLEPACVHRLLLQCPAGFRRGPRPERAAIQKYPDRVPREPQYAVAYGDAATRYRASRFDEDLWERLPGLRAPTLVLHGDDDELLAADSSRALAQRMGAARFTLVEDCGHAIETDQPDAFARLAARFLDNPAAKEKE